MRRWRGILLLVLLSLGLGVVTTYGVAWGCLNSVGPNQGSTHTTAGHNYIEANGWIIFPEMCGRAAGVHWIIASGAKQDTRASYRANEVPRWSLMRRTSSYQLYPNWNSSISPRCHLWERGAGWPMLAVVEREGTSPPAVQPTWQIGSSMRFGGAGTNWSGWVVAFTPIWRGFVVDVGVYAAAWAGLLCGVSGVRRRRRRAAGLCVGCRYDLSALAGGVCPECGSAVKGT